MSDTQRQIIFDTETTGLDPSGDHPDRLIEFAGLEMINRQFTGNKLHLFVHPERDISEAAFQVHGISLEHLQNEPKFAEVASEIADFIQGAQLIAHNANFDVKFLNMEFARCQLPSLEKLDCTIIDTWEMAKELFPGQKNSLDALCTRLGIDRSKRTLHGALIDCELLGEVYLSMTRNQFQLLDMEHNSTQSSSATQQPTQIFVRTQPLKVLKANDAECAEHEAYLNNMGNSLYRSAT